MSTTARVVPCRARFVVLVAMIALLPAQTHAQTEITVGPVITVLPSGSEPPASRLTGLALAAYNGPFGARLSGAMAIAANTRSTSGDRVSTVSDWIADGDVLVRIGSRDYSRTLSPNLMAFGFLGLGAVAWRDAIDSMRVARSWSQGGGIALGLGESIELSGEARYRRPLEITGSGIAPFAPRMEYRAGISLRFGGSSTRGHRRSTVRVGTSGRSGTVLIPTSAPSGGNVAARVIPTAEEYLGTPYRYGGSTPATGFDCSGFVRYVYAKHGVSLPRTSREMATIGTKLQPDFGTLRAGDLVMFAEKGEAISHVAVYAGGDRIIHASSSAGRVRYDDLDTDRGQWFRRRIVAARRVAPDARALVADLAASLAREGVRGLTFDMGDRAPRP